MILLGAGELATVQTLDIQNLPFMCCEVCERTQLKPCKVFGCPHGRKIQVVVGHVSPFKYIMEKNIKHNHNQQD